MLLAQPNLYVLIMLMLFEQKEPPEEMLTCVDVPDVGCIHFHKVQPSSNHGNADVNKAFPLANIPFTFQLDDMQTNFVDVRKKILVWSEVISKNCY